MKAYVLLVDDDEVLRLVLRILLEKAGLPVLEAGNGQQALSLFVEHQIALVITDIMMPVMDGIELIKSIKRNPENKAMPIIAMTAANRDGIQDQARHAGAIAVLAKPIDDGQFVSRIKSLICDTSVNTG